MSGVVDLKVLLVSPGESFDMKTSYLPIGLAYIGSYLQKHGVQVEGLDLRFLNSWDEATHSIAASGADVVSIGAMTIEMPRALRIAGIAKKHLGAVVVLGGPHPTVCSDEVIREKNVDIVVVGEGEHTVWEIIEALEGARGLHSVEGIIYHKDGKVVHNQGREPIADLDALPFPARDIFPLNKVLLNPVPNFPLPSPALNVFASRGCPFTCKFCQPCLNKIFGNRARYRSIKNVFDEIEYLISRYNLRGLMLEDDTFTVNKRWTYKFCEEMKKRGLSEKIAWYCHTRADTINRDMAHLLRDAGCISVCIGIESGSQSVLDILGKGTTEKQSCDVLRICKEEGLIVVSNIMIGTPGETYEDLDKTIKLIESMQPEMVYVGITTPTPGTYLFDEAEGAGIIQAESWTDFDRGKTSGKMKIDIDDATLYNVRKKLSIYGFSRQFLNESYYRDACLKRWKSFIDIGKPEQILKEING